jgi:kelch-like protein 17 (actinfilin)
MGRYDGASDLTSAESYSPMLNKWTAITPMGTKRSCLGTSSFEGLLYACGGYDGASCLSSMERYDPLTGVWTSCPAMSTRRRYCRIAVVGKHCSDWGTGHVACIWPHVKWDSSRLQ